MNSVPPQLTQADMWKLRDFAPGEGVRARAHLPEHADHAWLDIAVPGDVHLWWTHELGEPALYSLSVTLEPPTRST